MFLSSLANVQVTGSSDAIVTAPPPVRGAIRKSSKGPVPVHVQMLDGRVMQLFAEAHTTGQQFLDQSMHTPPATVAATTLYNVIFPGIIF